MSTPSETSEIICASCGAETPDGEICATCGDPVLLQERYRLLEIAGHGARGTIYRAHDGETGQQVAIKELSIRHVDDPKLLELCQREARLLRQLDHPAIPHYVDDFVAGHGRSRSLYLVQDFVAGRSLNDEMKEQRYDQIEVMEILSELSEILTYLHDLSPPVIHRDIKPGNVMRRDEDGRLVLVDFGSARDFIAMEMGGSTVAGTFGYMAPEQFQGDAVPATDIYGLGALAVGLLSRRDPATLHDYRQHFNWDEVLEPHPVVHDLLDAMLTPDPIDRIADASELQPRLARVIAVLSDPDAAAPAPLEPDAHAQDAPSGDLKLGPPPRRVPWQSFVIECIGETRFFYWFCTVCFFIAVGLDQMGIVGITKDLSTIAWVFPLLLIAVRLPGALLRTAMLRRCVQASVTVKSRRAMGQRMVASELTMRGWELRRSDYVGHVEDAVLDCRDDQGHTVELWLRGTPYEGGAVLLDPHTVKAVQAVDLLSLPRPNERGQWAAPPMLAWQKIAAQLALLALCFTTSLVLASWSGDVALPAESTAANAPSTGEAPAPPSTAETPSAEPPPSTAETPSPEPPPEPPDPVFTLFVDPEAPTIHVPDDAPTIMAALEKLDSTGTVLVAPGHYFENIGLIEKNVAIRGLGEPGSVVIEGQGRTGLSFSFGHLFLENITIRDSETGIMMLQEASLVMVGCELSENRMAINNSRSGSARIFSSLIHHNKIGLGFSYYGHDSLVVGSTFAHNSEVDIAWSPSWTRSELEVYNSILTGNMRADTGTTVRLHHSLYALREPVKGIVPVSGNSVGDASFEDASSLDYRPKGENALLTGVVPRGLYGVADGEPSVRGHSGGDSLAASSSELVFETVEQGKEQRATLTLYNFRDEPLQIHDHSVESAAFSLATPLPVALPPRAAVALTLAFHPAEAGAHLGELVLYADGLAEDGAAFPLHGAAVRLEGETIDVPGDAPTIQAALDLVGEDMTIQVAPGTYEENILVETKDFRLVGTEGAEDTILDAGGQIGLHLMNKVNGEIRGFTIANAHMGIWADMGINLVVSDSRILDNQVGLAARRGGELTIRHTLFANNKVGLEDTYDGTPSTVTNCTFADNGERDIHWSPAYTTARLEVESSILTGVIQAGQDGQPVKMKHSLYDPDRTISRVDNLEGNLSGAPLFVNPEAQDYRLQPGSPAVDAGSPDSELADADGTRNDMGYTGGK